MSRKRRSTKRSTKQQGNGCLMPGLFFASIALALVLGGPAAAMLDGLQSRYPDLPVDQSISAINRVGAEPTPVVYEPIVVYQAPAPTPVLVPFVVQPDDCDAQVTQLVPGGWAVGVSVLPPCWDSWDAEQQDRFMRTQRGLP